MLPSSENFAGAANSVRDVVGLAPTEENDSIFPSMSYKSRITGVAICFGAGCLISVLASLFLWTGATVLFATFYSLGSLVSIFSTLFLFGPARQCKMMFKPVRAAATIVFLCCILATLLIAFLAPRPALPCLIFIIVQFCAGIWYTLSYIPFARQIVLNCCQDATGVGSTV